MINAPPPQCDDYPEFRAVGTDGPCLDFVTIGLSLENLEVASG
jgi:hypothetical protein